MQQGSFSHAPAPQCVLLVPLSLVLGPWEQGEASSHAAGTVLLIYQGAIDPLTLQVGACVAVACSCLTVHGCSS